MGHVSYLVVSRVSKTLQILLGIRPSIFRGRVLSQPSIIQCHIYCSNFDTADTAAGSGPYWTMLVLPPPEFYVLPEEPGDNFWNSSVSLRTGILEFIDRVLGRAAKEWAELDPYFDRLDAKRELIFNPEQHDSLLFDDRHFSRSRLYFWAINSLGRFIQDINVTIERWERFWDENKWDIHRSERHLVDKQDKTKGKLRIGDKSVDDFYASILLRIQSLKNTRQRFESRRQKIIEYRDGVSNIVPAHALKKTFSRKHHMSDIWISPSLNTIYTP